MQNQGTLNLGQLVEGLHLNGDDNIHGQISYLAPNAGTIDGKAITDSNVTVKPDANSQGAIYNSNVQGDFIRVTFTGFSGNNYYTDLNGIRHQIGQIVVTYSDLELINGHQGSFLVGIHNGNARTWNGVDTLYVSSFKQKYEFYDTDGNLIDIAPGTAWLPVGSLSRYNFTSSPNDSSRDHIEKISVVSGGKAYAIEGGRATNHNGDIYLDHVDNGNTPNVFNTDGGAAIISITNGVILNPHIKSSNDPNMPDWNYYVSNLTTPLDGKTLTPPVKQNTSINYHYDVKIQKRGESYSPPFSNLFS